MKYFSPAAFKRLATQHPREARDATRGGEVAIQKTVLVPRSAAASNGETRFTLSTDAVDLERDRVFQNWDLADYRRNPVVLWDHDPTEPPIGRGVDVAVVSNRLMAGVQWVPADVPYVGQFAEACRQLATRGFLNAVSVGFLPLEYELAKDRMEDDDYLPPLNYLRNKLLEFSLVTVPANSQALIEPGQQRVASEAGSKAELDRAFERAKRRLAGMV